MSEFDNFYWKHNDCLNKDTSLAHSFGEKVWNHQQAKIDRLTLEIAEMKSRLNDNYTSGQTSMYLTKQAKIDLLEVQLKGAEERAKLTLDHKNKMVDELQKKYDAMYNAFIVADDCRKEWHESYMSVCKERDELQARIDWALRHVVDHGGYDDLTHVISILKGNRDEN